MYIAFVYINFSCYRLAIHYYPSKDMAISANGSRDESSVQLRWCPYLVALIQEHLSFIWNYFDENSQAYSWLIRFEDAGSEEQFQEGVMRALWERLNHQRWTKSNNEDREYVLQAFQGDVEMPDQPDEDEDDEYVETGLQGVSQSSYEANRSYSSRLGLL